MAEQHLNNIIEHIKECKQIIRNAKNNKKISKIKDNMKKEIIMFRILINMNNKDIAHKPQTLFY